MPVWQFDGIGTGWEIETDVPLCDDVRQRLTALIEAYDAIWSRFRVDSLVTRVAAARGGGTFRFPGEAHGLFDLYDRLHAATGGAVDPLAGHDLERLGYDAAYSLVPGAAGADRADRSWPRDVVRDGTLITTRQPVLIDVGAAGKGQLVDIVAAALTTLGVDRFVVDAGGDMVQAGPAPLAVGLEHPLDSTRIVGVAQLHGRALCASASNRRAWGEGLHHVIDVRTGVPTRSVLATWAIADDAMMADGLATALFFVAPERLAAFPPFEWVRMTADGAIAASPGFPGEIFV